MEKTIKVLVITTKSKADMKATMEIINCISGLDVKDITKKKG